jgi:hypothetical protein
LTRENRSSSENGPDHVWPDSEISAGQEPIPDSGFGQRPRIHRSGGPPLATPVSPEKANAILASLERIEAEAEQTSETDPKAKSKSQKKSKPAADPETKTDPEPEAKPKPKPKAKKKPKAEKDKAPAGPPRRKLRAYVWAMFAGALVAVLVGGTIGVVDAAGRHHDTATDAAGGGPTGAAPNQTPTQPAAGTGTAMAAPNEPSAAAVSAQPTGAAPNEVGAWPLTANALASFGVAPGVASHVTFAAGAAVFTGAATSDITTPAPMLQTGPGASFTVSAWVDLTAMPTSASKAATAVSQGAGIDSAFYLQYFEPSKRWAFARLDTDTAVSKAARTTSLAAAQVNVWTHLVGVYDASTGAVSLYVNSVMQGSTTDTTPFASSAGLEFGGARLNNAASDGFTGMIRNVSVFSQALSPQEVAALD